MTEKIQDQIYEQERKLWQAAKERDAQAFLTLVDEAAVMVCGGYRCTGIEYAAVIAMFDCKSYVMEQFEVVNQEMNSVQVHYVITLEVNDERNLDLAGKFHVTTTWKKTEDSWKVVFNMDQRIVA